MPFGLHIKARFSFSISLFRDDSKACLVPSVNRNVSRIVTGAGKTVANTRLLQTSPTESMGRRKRSKLSGGRIKLGGNAMKAGFPVPGRRLRKN